MTVSESCPFCAIAAGRIPAHKVAESERLVAFLDIAPVRPGHVLIVPRAHHPFFDDMPADVAAELVQMAQPIARALKRLYGVPRVAFMFTGTDVAHAHGHVIPMVEKHDVTSRRYFAEEVVTFRPLPRLPPEELDETARRIRGELSA